jgi:hypothetical protein
MTYSVKTLYPEFKCLTAHRAIMKRIETAGKKIDRKNENKGRSDIHFQLMTALKIDYFWYLKSDKETARYKRTQVNSDIFEKIWKDFKAGEMDLYKKTVLRVPPMSRDWEALEIETDKRNAIMVKNMPYMFHKIDGKLVWRNNKEYVYDKWIKYEMWQSAKKENFYDAMLTRDKMLGMANSLPDEIVGEIFSFL